MTTTETLVHSTDSVSVRLLTPTIVENIIHDNSDIDVKDIRQLKEINKRLTDGAKYAILVNSGMMTSITSEARELSANKDFQQETVAKALLIRSFGHRLVCRFYIKVNKPHIKTKIFSDRHKAVDWLKEQVREK